MSDRVLKFHYTLKDKEGNQLDSSQERGAFAVIEGRQQIIPGLEEELFKLNAGETKDIHVPAARAYGEVDDKLKMTVERSKLPEGEIKPGTQFRVGQEANSPVVTVTKVEEDKVHLDGNHPLAGQDLFFSVEVLEVREATDEEKEHGHAHGEGGAH